MNKNDNKVVRSDQHVEMKEIKVTSDVYYLTDQFVNVGFIGSPTEGNWFLVDAGLPNFSGEIKSIADKRFGRKPTAIILTHGHDDHTGGLNELLDEWNVPVYAHTFELPYLSGKKDYPKPANEPSRFTRPIDISNAIQPLPRDKSIPGMDDWQWIHTPGHSIGHVSLFREHDRILLAGDAFTTARQNPYYKKLTEYPEVNGPPQYLTTDWLAAWESVKKLESLQPNTALAGHGKVMEGKRLRKELKYLADNFDRIAIPEYGRFLERRGGLF